MLKGNAPASFYKSSLTLLEMPKKNPEKAEYEAAFDAKLLEIGMQLQLHKVRKNQKGSGSLLEQLAASMAAWQTQW